jgi:hypothetical protein
MMAAAKMELLFMFMDGRQYNNALYVLEVFQNFQCCNVGILRVVKFHKFLWPCSCYREDITWSRSSVRCQVVLRLIVKLILVEKCMNLL